MESVRRLSRAAWSENLSEFVAGGLSASVRSAQRGRALWHGAPDIIWRRGVSFAADGKWRPTDLPLCPASVQRDKQRLKSGLK